MSNHPFKRLIAAATAAVILATTLPLEASAEFNYGKFIDDSSMKITQVFVGNDVKVEKPDSKTFAGKTYETSKNAFKTFSVGEGADEAASLLHKGYVVAEGKVVKTVNRIGEIGTQKTWLRAHIEPNSMRRTGKMAWRWRRHENAKYWYEKFDKLKKWAPKGGEKVSKFLGGTADAGVAAYGFYCMWDEPTIGYKSPFLEFCGNTLRGASAAGSFLYRFVKDKAGGISTKAKAVSVGLTIADVAINNPIMVEIINDHCDDMGFLDDWTNIMNQSMQDIYDNVGDWLNYWIYGIEGDENEKLLAEMQSKCKGKTPQANGVGVLKPNIYVYPEETQNITVTFNEPGLLTVTDPLYGNGWSCTASPDGKLTVSGSEYGYLFYEAETNQNYFTNYEGFVIPADKREETFTEILMQYGLNDREIHDFTEFWCEKLDEGCDYSMYPHTTEVIDEVMPMTVSPETDSVFRIWFVFEKDSVPEKTAEIIPFERNGFTVVEWGGIIAS